MTLTMPSTKAGSKEAAQELVERAVINRNNFHNLKQLKPGQARWQHERAIEASHEFEDVADDATWVKFWTRENVVADIEAGDVAGVFNWLTSKIYWIDFRKRQKEARERVEMEEKYDVPD